MDNLFQVKKFESPKEFVSLFEYVDVFLKYLLAFIPDHPYYLHQVLSYEAVTKIIMDLEKSSYEMAVGIGLGLNGPTKTPEQEWYVPNFTLCWQGDQVQASWKAFTDIGPITGMNGGKWDIFIMAA